MSYDKKKVAKLIKIGRYDEALQLCDEEIQSSSPDEEKARIAKGDLLLKLGKHQEALECYKGISILSGSEGLFLFIGSIIVAALLLWLGTFLNGLNISVNASQPLATRNAGWTLGSAILGLISACMLFSAVISPFVVIYALIDNARIKGKIQRATAFVGDSQMAAAQNITSNLQSTPKTVHNPNLTAATCPACSGQIQPNARFCIKCGRQL